jgi:hypothetical protein
MVMTAASVFVNGITWLSIVYLVGFFFITYLYLRWLPHMHAWVNHVRVATAFCLLYASLLLIILAYHPGVAGDDEDGLASFRWEKRVIGPDSLCVHMPACLPALSSPAVCKCAAHRQLNCGPALRETVMLRSHDLCCDTTPPPAQRQHHKCPVGRDRPSSSAGSLVFLVAYPLLCSQSGQQVQVGGAGVIQHSNTRPCSGCRLGSML